jgi:hypothetical protein
VAVTLAAEVWPHVRSYAPQAWSELEKAVWGSFQRHFLQYTGIRDTRQLDCTFAITALAFNALRRQQSAAIMADTQAKTPDRSFLALVQEDFR